MKIFLTGGTGMVARNILEHPEAKKHEIIVSSSKDLNLIDRESVRLRIKKEKPDLIIHAAAVVSGIHANITYPVKYMTDNMYMGLNVILEAYHAGIPNLLNFGSSCMYPKDIGKGLREDHILTGPLEPTNEGYALSKISSTRLCEFIMRESKAINYKTLIPCNIYGRYDNFDPNFSHLIPAVIRKLDEAVMNKTDCVDIWGDGESRREFISASQIASFVFKAIDSISEIPQNLNLGLGYDYSIKDYYEKIADMVGFGGKFKFDLTKPSGMKQKLCDISQLQKLNWQSNISLEEGLKETYDFYIKEIRDEI